MSRVTPGNTVPSLRGAVITSGFPADFQTGRQKAFILGRYTTKNILYGGLKECTRKYKTNIYIAGLSGNALRRGIKVIIKCRNGSYLVSFWSVLTHFIYHCIVGCPTRVSAWAYPALFCVLFANHPNKKGGSTVCHKGCSFTMETGGLYGFYWLAMLHF